MYDSIMYSGSATGLVHSQIPSSVPLILITVKYTYLMKITASCKHRRAFLLVGEE